jgi:prepilin-type N-terminal cleavage/methylation domain-containing protein
MNQTNIVNRELTGCVPPEIDSRNKYAHGNKWHAESNSIAGSNSILKGLRLKAQGCEERATLGLRPHHNRAFTLIELLVVIAVMAILAALVIPVTGAVKAASTKARARTELAQIETAIDRYKIKLGHYPPDNPPVNPDDPVPMVNQLYYELMGTTNDGRFYRTLDGSASVDISMFSSMFSPRVSGFVNSTKGGGGDEGGSPQRFLDTGLKPSQIAKAPASGATILVGIPWQKGPPPFDVPPFGPSAPPINPWRYNSSRPIHNPNSYDLWLDVMIGSKAFRICNWSKQPLRITDLKP